MSPELETLDQLQGGPLPLSVIANLYDDRHQFVQAAKAMLNASEVSLLDEGVIVPRWEWEGVLAGSDHLTEPGRYRLAITLLGARRVC